MRFLLVLLTLLAQLATAQAQWGELKTRCRTQYKVFPAARSTSNFFEPAQECPASEIHLSEVELVRAWEKATAQLTSSGTHHELGAEFQSILELNLWASKIWERFLAEANGDAELARTHYRQHSTSRELKVQLIELRDSLAQFAETSPFWVSEQSSNGLMMTLKGVEFPAVHPLFVQLLLENIAQVRIFHLLDLDYRKKMTYGGSTAPGDSSPEGRSLNLAMRFLFFVPADQCSNFGLWPRAARGLLYALRTISTYRSYNTIVGDARLMESIPDKVYRGSCGSPMADGNTADPYANHDDKFVRAYRAMRFK